jgi:hypothetical protein
VLPKGLYQEWRRPEGDHDRVQRQYYGFARSLAEASLRRDEETFQQCLDLAKADPFASLVAALVEYLHNGRRRSSAFIASLPRNKKQLADFSNLDDAVSQPREGITALPGIPLPDGLAEKITTELFLLVRGGNRAAAREYFFLYAHADGGYAEFIQGQVTGLCKEDARFVLRNWSLFKPYGEKLGESEDISLEDYRSISMRFKTLCRGRRDQDCQQILKIFH